MLDQDRSRRRLPSSTWRWPGWTTTLALAALLAGCGGSKASSSSGPLSITPTQLYSGFDGTTPFHIGAIANGAAHVTWSIGDPSIADLQANGAEVTLTTKSAGSTMLTVTDGTHTASVPLTVTQYTLDQHMTGRMRYTRGDRQPRRDGGVFMIPDGGFGRGGSFEDRKPCTDCHGIARIEHGPNQCGWMSDDELKHVILDGTRPDGSPVYDQDDSLSHHWRVEDPDALVAYIRSLAARGTPTQQ